MALHIFNKRPVERVIFSPGKRQFLTALNINICARDFGYIFQGYEIGAVDSEKPAGKPFLKGGEAFFNPVFPALCAKDEVV